MSSSSKSRSSRKSKRPEKPDALRPVVTPDSDEGTNLFALVMGMVTAIVLIFGVFGFGGDPVVNEKYNREQSKRQEARDEAARAASLEDMQIQLAKLQELKPGSILDVVNICRQRIAVSNEIISRGPKNESMRETAVTQGLLAHVKLYGVNFKSGLGIEDVGESLQNAYEPYLDDENPKIYSHARVAKLTHRSFESMKHGQDEGELIELFADTIERFPEDEYVGSMIEAHMMVLLDKDAAYTRTLYTSLRDRNPPGSLKPAMEKKMYNIADHLLLESENFGQKFADRWANGKAGRMELTKTASRLLNQPESGMLVLGKVSRLAQWLERNEFPELATSVFEDISASVDKGNLREECLDVAGKISEYGLKRLQLQGKTMTFRGVDSVGKQLDDEQLKKEVVLAVYWSAGSASSIKYLDTLNKSARNLLNKPVSILAVCVDKELPKNANVLTQKYSVIRIVDPVFKSGQNSLLADAPPGAIPHAMLIDFGGKVHDINADPTQVTNEALGLLMNRGR